MIPDGENFVFGASFCFHPESVNPYILKEIKRVREVDPRELEIEKEKLIVRLFKMKHKHEQYRHVDIQEIYSNSSKMRI